MTAASNCRRKRRALAGAFAALLLALMPATGRAAGLLIPVGREDSMAIAEQKVTVHINNGIAVTTVDQTFRNPLAFAQEAVYRFPIPERASVSNFSMWINGQEVIGEVLEKQKARQIYDEVTRPPSGNPKDPGLLEQTNYKWFEMRVSPVPANGTQRIQITYYQPLDYDAGYVVYTYPLEVAGVAKTALDGEFSILVDVVSPIPLTQVYSPSHQKDLLVRQATPQRYRAGVEIARGDLRGDFVLVGQLAREQTQVNLVTSRKDKGDGYFMLSLTPSAAMDRQAAPINYIFVLDVSGSMRELGKLPLARSAVEQMLGTIRPEDRFNIVTFNIAPESLARQSLPGEQAHKDRAREYLNKLNAAGGTDLLAAMQLAAGFQSDQMRNAIVLLSDGQATTTNDFSDYLPLLNDRKANTTVFSFGIGNEVNRPLLGTLADRSGGLADYVSGQEDLARKVDSLKTRIDSPMLSDVVIDWGGQDVYDLQPATPPNLYRGQQLVVFGRYRKTLAGPIALRGQMTGQARTFAAQADWPAESSGNPEIERMWAQQMCETLDRALSTGVGGEGERKRIVELGTQFDIVTPYTSFLVLENEAMFKRYGIERANVQRVAHERAAQQSRNAWNPAGGPAGDPVADADRPRGGGGGSVEWIFLTLCGGLLAVGGIGRRRRG